MDLSSWFRRRVSNSDKNPKIPQSKQQQEDQQQLLLGVTDRLIDHIKSFTLDTFKNFPLQDDEEAAYDVEAATNSSGNIREDLTEWQERHAFLVLSKVKELAQLRFKLCPRYLKEKKFWRIYFILVKSHVAEYELQAIRLAELKSLAMENEKTSDSRAYEVEMSETKQVSSLSPPTL